MTRRGFTYIEVLVAAMLLSISAAAALSTWGLADRAAANKRVTEVAEYVAVTELERLRAPKYLGIPDTPTSPQVRYYGPSGAPASGPASLGFQTRAWCVTNDTDGDGQITARDLKELTVEVWDATGARRYERLQTLITWGGS